MTLSEAELRDVMRHKLSPKIETSTSGYAAGPTLNYDNEEQSMVVTEPLNASAPP